MAILRNVFRSSGGLQGWTVTFPPQWKQQDSVNCGIFMCSAVENEVQKHTVTAEPLTLSQCRTLRVHHASEIMKSIDPEDFPPTFIESIEMEKKENKLQETELKKTDSSIHCLAWKIRACLFQRATGKTFVFHDHIKTYKWVQCTSCKNWLHFQCAGLPEDWNESEFFCGCSLHSDIDNLVESVEAVDIITDADIKVLEQKLQTGDILSNRMYLWKHKGLDLAIRKHYSEQVTAFNDITTDVLIKRLENILLVPGSGLVDQRMITEVILPEAVIHWLQSTINLCHYQAEMVLLRTVKDNEGNHKVQQKQGTEKVKLFQQKIDT
ncbi:uncharacterized protein LOC108238812 [Kryptolebias marmoratus]|uniref:uncharacterized protein LOC108238812 n=1 Tax=Kryptolebias marmoratus TaxID=37003 RepID=UPI000D52FC68|nr:uncharacterized protein LOC108238812 [Kryptolebias marmoratus]XP_037831958.1 uncharacterized protein LOC108238812 [Kryptolebias marmoratus]